MTRRAARVALERKLKKNANLKKPRYLKLLPRRTGCCITNINTPWPTPETVIQYSPVVEPSCCPIGPEFEILVIAQSLPAVTDFAGDGCGVLAIGKNLDAAISLRSGLDKKHKVAPAINRLW